jgi:hypothetical protein
MDPSPLTSAPRRFALALLALAVCLFAPFAWLLTLSSPWLRRSAAVAWAVLAVGVLLGLVAARTDRRLRVRVLAGLDLLVLAGFAWMFAFGLAEPPTPQTELLVRAPDFTLPDQESRPVALSAELSRGPVLLVFYRGHW